jgi:hypothetical protein
MYHLRTTVQKLDQEAHPHVIDSPNLPRDPELKSPWLLDLYSCQLRKSSAGANTVCSRAESVSILERYFASKSFAVAREAFSNAYPDKEDNNTLNGNKTSGHRKCLCVTIAHLATKQPEVRPCRFQAVQ